MSGNPGFLEQYNPPPVKISSDNTVICPQCSNEFPVHRQNPRGAGAGYVSDWTTLPRQHIKIILVWLSHENLSEYPRSKVMIRDLLNRYSTLNLSENACSARLSELLGLKIIKIADREDRDDPHHTTHEPRYVLDVKRATDIINNGGKL